MKSEKPMSKTEKACGIDFGTSEIAVAVVDAVDPMGAKLVPNMLSNETTPGVLKIYREVRTIGEDAAATATMCPKNVYSSFPLILKYADCIDQLQGRYPDLCFQMKADAQRSTIFDVLDDPVLSEMSIMHAISMVFRYCYQIVSKKSPEYTRHTVIPFPPACLLPPSAS